ncbi:MAG: zinc-dependent peptidase [Uliginosibacterium sp.]|jgi:Mlc titration factor MtfA (ptsG expression regulator)|nr:zinc-dependent peptidase [Uliginosibacterium sp.]
MLTQIKRWLWPAVIPTVSEADWRAVERTLPCLNHLDHAEREALRALALAFLDRKVFSGAQGFEPDNAARLSIALQACLLVLKLGLHAYDGWEGVIVYPPGGFMIPQRRQDAAGVVHEYEQEALGQAWDDGPVLLTWADDPTRDAGINVVIHEFAHKLDMLDGHVDGRPPLPPGIRPEAWRHSFSRAYADFCARADSGLPLFMDAYAAEDPGEFFAMCCEVFFCKPVPLRAHYPDVYALLCGYFQQRPLPEPPPPG